MKHLILFLAFTASTFTTQAQDSKPTKEQTVAYLNQYYSLNSWSCSTGEGARNSIYVTNISLSDSCTLTIKSRWEYFFPAFDNYPSTLFYQDYITVIDMNKVEKLSYEGFVVEKPCTLYYLKFTAMPGAKLYESKKGELYGGYEENTSTPVEVKIPLGQLYGDASFTGEVDKVKQAFNHLRKLCGAPDPIKFD